MFPGQVHAGGVSCFRIRAGNSRKQLLRGEKKMENQADRNGTGRRAQRVRLLAAAVKTLFFYLAVPALVFALLAGPMGEAVRASDAAAWWILLAFLGAVVLNWQAYTLLRRRRPGILVIAYGILCLLAAVLIEIEALPGYQGLASSLALAAGALALAVLFLFGIWCASLHNRAGRISAAAVQIVLGLTLCLVAYQIIRDIEIKKVTRDTWITLAIFLLAVNASWILFAFRRARFRSRTREVAPGRIVQVIGETSLDRDDDAVTRHFARVRFEVNGAAYETRASVSRRTVRKLGREKLVGWVVPVYYNPGKPSEAFAKRIDAEVFGRQPGVIRQCLERFRKEKNA